MHVCAYIKHQIACSLFNCVCVCVCIYVYVSKSQWHRFVFVGVRLQIPRRIFNWQLQLYMCVYVANIAAYIIRFAANTILSADTNNVRQFMKVAASKMSSWNRYIITITHTYIHVYVYKMCICACLWNVFAIVMKASCNLIFIVIYDNSLVMSQRQIFMLNQSALFRTLSVFCNINIIITIIDVFIALLTCLQH